VYAFEWAILIDRYLSGLKFTYMRCFNGMGGTWKSRY
jgi:hypothetical protein